MIYAFALGLIAGGYLAIAYARYINSEMTVT